jgi:hypothetical protein
VFAEGVTRPHIVSSRSLRAALRAAFAWNNGFTPKAFISAPIQRGAEPYRRDASCWAAPDLGPAATKKRDSFIGLSNRKTELGGAADG